jgi:tRNA A-37 threonylcarbamoyl transferase component Bud32
VLGGYGIEVSTDEYRFPGLTLLRQIGTGGMSEVHLARQVELDRLVAVKVLRERAEDRAATWQQLRHEARAVARLSGHPHVVTVYTAGVTRDGCPYLVTEYLPQGSLADAVAARGPLPVGEVGRIGAAIAGALLEAHRCGLLHLDVTPANVLVAGDGTAKLCDFGISRFASTAPRNQGALTPAHAAPETISGDPESGATDVYGLASTLVTALLGHPPFTRTQDERIEALLDRKRSTVPDLPARVAPSLAGVLTRALAIRPGERPSLHELRETLIAVADEHGAPVAPDRAPDVTGTVTISRTTPLPSAAGRALGAVRRRPGVLARVALAAALGTAGAALVLQEPAGRAPKEPAVQGGGTPTTLVAADPAPAAVAPPPAPVHVGRPDPTVPPAPPPVGATEPVVAAVEPAFDRDDDRDGRDRADRDRADRRSGRGKGEGRGRGRG